MKSLKREQAYKQIRDAISFGELKPGEKVGEEATSDKFHLGRTPLREALRQLESEGYVEVVPYKGAVVRKISPRELEQVYELLGVIEGYAVEKATASMTHTAIKQLEKIQAEMVRAAKNADYTLWLDKNALFHQHFQKASVNELLSAEIDNLRRRAYRYRVLAVSIHGHVEEYLDHHLKILEAVIEKEAEQAAHAMRSHLLAAGRNLIKFVKDNPWL
jgi:DNA-binding GntR family transcriptional regulator